MIRSKQFVSYSDRKSNAQKDIVHDRRRPGKGKGCARPVAENVAQMFYCGAYRLDSTSSSISSINPISPISLISPINAVNPSRQARRKLNRIVSNNAKGGGAKNHDLLPLRWRKSSDCGETKASIVKNDSLFNATSNDMTWTRPIGSSTNVSWPKSIVSNGEDRKEIYHNKKVMQDLSNDLVEDGRIDGRGLLGTSFDIASQDGDHSDITSSSTDSWLSPLDMQQSCDSFEEGSSDLEEESLPAELTSDEDSQYDTDLEDLQCDDHAPYPSYLSYPSHLSRPSKRNTNTLNWTWREVYESECRMKGTIPASYLLARFTTSKVLLPHRGLGPRGGQALAKALAINTYIETLDLSDNGFGSIGGKSMAIMLHQNHCITDLDLSENNLDTSAGIAIAKGMVFNKTIKRLVLRGNNFKDKVAMAFAGTLKDNRILNEFDLSYNKLGETGGLYLGAGLSLNCGLTKLSVKWNAIRGKGAIAIAHALGMNETLQSLDLSWNSLGYTGAIALSANLSKNQSLRHLDLRNNHLNEDAVFRLAPTFAHHKNLEVVKLGLNPIGQEGISAIFEAVTSNPKIRHIGLQDISVPVKFLSVIEKLKAERDAVVVMDSKTRLTVKKPEKEGMDILLDFLKENSLRLKDMFFRLDKDHSGDISRNEFKHGLKEMGILMDSTQLDKLIKEIDKDENNKIDYSEILGGHKVARLEKRRKTMARSEIRRMEQAALLLPEMDAIKNSLTTQRL